MARHRRRRQNGMRCLFIELRETEIDQLIRHKLLAPDSRNDLGALRKACTTSLMTPCGDAQLGKCGMHVMRYSGFGFEAAPSDAGRSTSCDSASIVR
jgi:hypothetical protein